MKLRLFIALSLTKGLIKKIAFLEKRIEKKAKLKIPWIDLKNLHLTILFLGNVSYEDYLKIEKIFDQFEFQELKLKVTKVDYGPPGKKRMIWLYLEKNQSLEKIKNFFEEKLTELKVNYKREEREYLPHINLARLKKINSFPEIKEDLGWGIILNQIVLYRSYLKPEKAEYEKLKIVNATKKENLGEIF